MLGSAADTQMMPGKGWRGSVGACDEKKLPNKWGASELGAEPKYIELRGLESLSRAVLNSLPEPFCLQGNL